MQKKVGRTCTENLLNMCKAHCYGSGTLSKDRAFTGEEKRNNNNNKKKSLILI